MRLVIVTLALALLAPACPPAPVPPDAGDGGAIDAAPPSSVYGRACRNLETLGCSEGSAANCAVVLEHLVVSRTTRTDPTCLASAATKAAARACGGVACP